MKLASFETIVRALTGAGVRYLVVGGLAVNAHGYGRKTHALPGKLEMILDTNALSAWWSEDSSILAIFRQALRKRCRNRNAN